MWARIKVCVGVGTLVVLVSFVAAIPALAQVGHVLGIVTDETGEPIKGATIRVATHQDSAAHLTATSGENGHFSFLVQRSGQWDFIVEAPGFASASGSARVRFGVTRPIIIEFTLERRETPELWGVLAGVNPQLISTQLAGAEALLAAGRYEEAIAAYQNIKAQTPALSVVGLQLGNAYLQKKDYDSAEAEFQVVLKSEAANAAACYDLGQVKAARGLSDEAAAWYQKAVTADPHWTKPLMGLAVLAQSKDDREAAIGYLKRVIALNPDSPEAAQAAALLGRSGRVN